MDQMVSGSGFYPIRLLDESWLTPREVGMVQQLERLLEGTGHGHSLAMDMLTFLVYDVDVRIVLDNSGSMSLDMFGRAMRGTSIDATSYEDPSLLRQALNSSLPPGWFSNINVRTNLQSARGGPSPFHRRWWFARDAIRRWMSVFQVMGLDPMTYLLNRAGSLGTKCRGSQLEQVFASPPSGTTAMTEALQCAVDDHRQQRPDRPLLLLVITDGEANNMQTFNRILDQIQNGVYGDVQVCLMGLSLVKADIEWFENEECDETRIRTVEAFEVEQRQIQLKEVVKKEGNYNFLMHTYRVLVTNYYPADYDYEAHLQNFRHRLYITLHGRDRWYGINNLCWRCCCSGVFCTTCFLGTCCHCCGWCQGNDCCKYQTPEMLECFFGEG